MSHCLPDLRVSGTAQRYAKRVRTVAVRFAREPGTCRTLEGDVPYVAGDALITGIAGETWPVRRAAFTERYASPEDGVPWADGNYVTRPIEVRAVRLDAPIDVQLAGGGILHGEIGDWLVQQSAGSYAVVRNDIFLSTYELLAAGSSA